MAKNDVFEIKKAECRKQIEAAKTLSATAQANLAFHQSRMDSEQTLIYALEEQLLAADEKSESVLEDYASGIISVASFEKSQAETARISTNISSHKKALSMMSRQTRPLTEAMHEANRNFELTERSLWNLVREIEEDALLKPLMRLVAATGTIRLDAFDATQTFATNILNRVTQAMNDGNIMQTLRNELSVEYKL